MAQIPRLYIDQELSGGQTLAVPRDAAHYLFSVMRLTPGAEVELFNGRDGEWRAEVVEAGKRGGVLRCLRQSAPQGAPPDLWLLFAPVKKAQTDFIVEKAVEMGAARLCPVSTDFTNSDRIRPDKMRARVIEAAEQCAITYLPQVADLARLGRVLDHWPEGRKLMFCDETARLTPAEAARSELMSHNADQSTAPWAILIGPEGGFSPAERDRLRKLPFTVPVSLGPRILRAETAAVAALALWQSTLGDWGAGGSDTPEPPQSEDAQ